MANHIATTKPNAMTVYGEISPWREAANEEQGASFGTLLKFVKGDWLIGEEQEPVAPTATFIVNMEEYWRGWIKWLDKEPVDHRIGRVVDRHRVHLREELGDLDQSRWETDANGVPRDPWQRVSYLVMRNTSNDDIVTFTSTSDGGRKAVAKLADRYDRLRRKHLGKMPVVALTQRSYPHAKYGKVLTPKFNVVGWEYFDDEAKDDVDGTLGQEQTRKMDDEIPF
jgi:hypothetical protein